MVYYELIWSQLIKYLDNKEFEYDFTQKNKFNNTDPNTNTPNTKAKFINESHTSPPTNSPKQSHIARSNFFKILQISSTNTSREIKISISKIGKILFSMDCYYIRLWILYVKQKIPLLSSLHAR